MASHLSIASLNVSSTGPFAIATWFLGDTLRWPVEKYRKEETREVPGKLHGDWTIDGYIDWPETSRTSSCLHAVQAFGQLSG